MSQTGVSYSRLLAIDSCHPDSSYAFNHAPATSLYRVPLLVATTASQGLVKHHLMGAVACSVVIAAVYSNDGNGT